MASESVNKILKAEADSNEKISQSRKKAEEIISEAEKYAALSVQKKIAEAKTQTDRIKSFNSGQLAEYAGEAEEKCSHQIEDIRSQAAENTDKAVDEVIRRFFS